jgi:hypothetical protein
MADRQLFPRRDGRTLLAAAGGPTRPLITRVGEWAGLYHHRRWSDDGRQTGADLRAGRAERPWRAHLLLARDQRRAPLSPRIEAPVLLRCEAVRRALVGILGDGSAFSVDV